MSWRQIYDKRHGQTWKMNGTLARNSNAPSWCGFTSDSEPELSRCLMGHGSLRALAVGETIYHFPFGICCPCERRAEVCPMESYGMRICMFPLEGMSTRNSESKFDGRKCLE